MARIPELLTRRRVLVGMAAVAPLSVVGGVGASVLLGDQPRPGPERDHATLAVAVQGRAVEATPSLVAAPVHAGSSGRRRMRLAVRDGPGGRLSLAFETVRSDGGSGDWLDVTVGVDGEPVRSGPFEAVFDGTAEHLGDRLCPGSGSRLTVTWTAADRPLAGDREVVATGRILVGLEPGGCPGRQ